MTGVALPSDRARRLRPAGQRLLGRAGRGSACGLIALGLAMICLQGSPPLQSLLELDRRALADGQLWRLVTGSFVHFGWSHLAADLCAWGVLCWVAHGRGRGALGVVCVSAATIGAAVWAWAGEVEVYRGLSGVASGVLGWVLVVLAVQDRRRRWLWVGVALAAGAKFSLEWALGTSLTPTSLPAGVELAGVAHVVGLATGALLALADQALRTPGLGEAGGAVGVGIGACRVGGQRFASRSARS